MQLKITGLIYTSVLEISSDQVTLNSHLGILRFYVWPPTFLHIQYTISLSLQKLVVGELALFCGTDPKPQITSTVPCWRIDPPNSTQTTIVSPLLFLRNAEMYRFSVISVYLMYSTAYVTSFLEESLVL